MKYLLDFSFVQGSSRIKIHSECFWGTKPRGAEWVGNAREHGLLKDTVLEPGMQEGAG